MKRKSSSFPAAYWVYLCLFCLFAVLLMANIFVTDALTGEKDFSLYQKRDWLYFVLFLLAELLIGGLMYLFAAKACKFSAERNRQMRRRFHELRDFDLRPEEFERVWFDEAGYLRAKVRRDGDGFSLMIDRFSFKTETWMLLEPTSIHASLEDAKDYLIENDFFCKDDFE